MARINLLPWRDERRLIRKREFWMTMGAVAAASAIAVFAAMMFMDSQIEAQRARNQFLTDQITQLELKIEKIKDLEKEKARLLKRKEIIEQLQGSRSVMVHLFAELAKSIPEGVFLNGIKQSGETITLEGKAQSDARVAQYMRNLDASPWLQDPDLQIVQVKETATAASTSVQSIATKASKKTFALRVSIQKPKVEAPAGTVPEVPATPVASLASGASQ